MSSGLRTRSPGSPPQVNVMTVLFERKEVRDVVVAAARVAASPDPSDRREAEVGDASAAILVDRVFNWP